jgi:hypothetical protein
MPSASFSDVKLEIGHVLFVDSVGYSKLLINEQSEQMQTLREIDPRFESFVEKMFASGKAPGDAR